MSEPKLCYVEGCFAYFTTQELSQQTGDDWDDAPYEHNAGAPYTGEGWEIIKVAFDNCGLDTPDWGRGDSRYSVNQINAGHAPWLRQTYKDNGVAIPAGTPLDEFKNIVRKIGGRVYVLESAVSENE